MAAILIAHDLHKLGQRYRELIKTIEANFPGGWHCLESTFIVTTSKTAAEVRDLIKAPLDSNDELLVVKLAPQAWASKGLDKPCNDWLRSNV